MSLASDAFAAVKNVLLFREEMRRTREELVELTRDVGALARDHGQLAERVATLEGFVRGVTAAGQPSGRRRLPKPD